MGIFVNLAAGALLLASVYCLVNLGLVLLYRTTGVLNFALGQFVLIGAYILSSLVSPLGYWLGLLVATLCMASIAWLSYQLLIRFMLGSSEFEKVIMTFMLAIVITQVVVMSWGVGNRQVRPSVSSTISVLGGRVPAYDLVAAGLAAGFVVGLLLFIFKTGVGLRLRAIGINETLATFNGARVHQLAGLAWAVAGATAAVAAAMYTQISAITLSIQDIGLLAFPAAVLGGLRSLGGSVVGSLMVGAILTTVDYYLGGQFAAIVLYAFLLLVLSVRPYGLFGRPEASRL